MKYTMTKLPALLLLLAGIFLLALAACGPTSSTGTGGTGGLDPASAAYITIAAAERSTAVAANATATAQAAAVQGTAQAIHAQETQAAAIAQATAAQATVVSDDMTRMAVIATATRSRELDAADDARIEIELAARNSSLEAANAINAQIVADNQRRLDDDAQQRATDAKLQAARSILLMVVIALMSIVIFVTLVVIILDRFHKMRRREEAMKILQGGLPQPTQPQRAQIPATAAPRAPAVGLTVTTPNANGHSNGNGYGNGHPRLNALPPAQRTAILQDTAAQLHGLEANWQQFARWRQPDRVVIGVGVNGPIIFDLALLPHIFAAGASRKGKSSLVRVYLAYIATCGYNVVILNERSSDFAGLESMPNVMNLRGFTQAQRLSLAQNTFEAAVVEMNRRDQILHAAKIPTWREYLRQEPGEAPITFIFVDEFLELTQGETAARNALMSAALTISSQAGKFGLGIGLTATDPTQRALGDIGYSVIQNCARICLGVNNSYASVSVLGDGSAFGLPAGQFIAIDHDGQRHAGIGFNPSPNELTDYVTVNKPASIRPFPPALARVPRIVENGGGDGRADAGAAQGVAWPSNDAEQNRIIEDAQLIGTLTGSNRMARALDSRSAICEYLYEEGHIGWGRTGQNVRRVELALMYLADRGNEWAQMILAKSRSSAVTQEDSQLLMNMATVEA